MNYQFEDESALEELLNQQLDSRKSVQSRQKPANQRSQPQNFRAQLRPSTAISSSGQASSLNRQVSTFDDSSLEQTANRDEQTAPKGKLASWLDKGANKPKAIIDDEQASQRPSTSYKSVEIRRPPDLKNDSIQQPVIRVATRPANQYRPEDKLLISKDLTEMLRETKLQEMSKQGLIALIVENITPTLDQLQKHASEFDFEEMERLKTELERERYNIRTMQFRHEQQLEFEHQKGLHQAAQLEQQLKMSEQELEKNLQLSRDHQVKLDDQYRASIAKLSESLDSRVEVEKSRFEQQLSNLEAMHKLELECRLHVDSSFGQLEVMQKSWQDTLKRTLDQMQHNFKQMQVILDKQTIQVNGTNLELAEKAKRLSEQYGKLELAGERASQLTDSLLKDHLPGLSSFREESEHLLVRIDERLSGLDKIGEQLNARQTALDEKQGQLEKLRMELSDNKLKQTIESSRLQMKEEKLAEMIEEQRVGLDHLRQKEAKILERENQVQANQVSLEAKSVELREQNLELHLQRKRLTNDKELLNKLQLEVATEKKSLRIHSRDLKETEDKLSKLQDRVNLELDQLKRVQKSLICSICLNRLFSDSEAVTMIDQRIHSSKNDSSFNVIDFNMRSSNKTTKQAEDDGKQYVPEQSQNANPFLESLETLKSDFLGKRRESHLKAESKYVELLSTNNHG